MSDFAAAFRLSGQGGALGVFGGKGIKTMKYGLSSATALATAAIAIGALASPVMAKTLTFTFGIDGGGAHCDGVTLTQATVGHPTWGGTLTGCSNGDPAGGYSVGVNGGKNLDIATTNTAVGPYEMTFFLNLKQNEWYLYEVVSGDFEQIDSGPLIKGAPSAKVPAAKAAGQNARPQGKLDQMW